MRERSRSINHMEPTSSILEKIRKIHALAERAGTEAEAANAAQRVADLCRQHNLDIGVATLQEEETKATEALHAHKGGKWQAHWSYLALACDKLFDVAHYRGTEGRAIKNATGIVTGRETVSVLHFYGLKANVASAVVTYEYLLASVEAMLESHLIGSDLSGASDYHSFRIGCADRIDDEAAKIVRQAVAYIAPSEESTAVVRLGNQLIQAHYKERGLRRSGSSSSGAANRDAYSAGYAAGGRVDIHGARTSRMLR